MAIAPGRSATPANPDDLVLPFQTVASRMIGRVVRLGGAADSILKRHDYPVPVSEVLGEALALSALLGTALNFEGRLIVQTRSDGAIGFLVTQFDTPGQIRGYASSDRERIGAAVPSRSELLGTGHLAMTIDPGEGKERYQGIVPLDGVTLTEAAETYFRQSEQLPTFIRLAVARHFVSGSGSDRGWHWRAGGIMVQHVAPEAAPATETEEDEERLLGDADDHWQRVRLLAATVEDHELTDPTLTPEVLLYRLFHEEGVRAMPARPIAARCRCSRERVHTFMRSFGAAELSDMREPDGLIAVTCEFCNTKYRYTLDEIG
jgi:molecular chaperone Hsp33